jgi:hypothetical protein
LVIAVGLAMPASSSTFARVGLDYLVAENDTAVVGQVLSARSYWNEARTFILTDVRLAVSEVLKGPAGAREITVTIPGGQVGDLAAVIVGGADLKPGKWYVLFLDRVDLMGARNVLTVHDHCQGAFDVEAAGDGLRAVSQGRRHELLPDVRGNADPVGGAKGMPFIQLTQTVREMAGRLPNSQPEVRQ